eukprot:675731_1
MATDVTRPTKLWHANFKKCLGIEFELHSDECLTAIELNFSFGGIKCHGLLSSYISNKHTFDLISAYWIRTHNVHIPYHVYPQTMIDLMSQHADCDDRYKSRGSPMKLVPNHSKPNKTIFTPQKDVAIKLSSKHMMYKLAFIISDGFYCNNYLIEQEKYSIHGNLKYIKFCMMNRYLLHHKGREIHKGCGGEETSSWFPSFAFINDSQISLPSISAMQRTDSRNI